MSLHILNMGVALVRTPSGGPISTDSQILLSAYKLRVVTILIELSVS